MIKGRMFVVNEDTLNKTITDGVASIMTPSLTGEQWLKTIADIMADMLQIEIGDYIFLWETKSKTQKSRIHGVFRAISAPYYETASPDDNCPFKIKIERAYDFENPLDEYSLLNCPYIKTPLWTVTGKKVAGKARGSSPLSQNEVQQIITLLIGRNPNYNYIPFDRTHIVSPQNPIQINYNNHGNNDGVNRALPQLNPNNLNFLNTDYSLKYEKVLETIFNQEMAAKNSSFYNQIGINVSDVVWFSNYLPYSLEQSEMDYLIIESYDKISINKISLIEFMIDRIDKDHIQRCLLYSKWVNETLSLGVSATQPILICSKSYDFINGERTQFRQQKANENEEYIKNYEDEYMTKPLLIYTYDFSTGRPLFVRKR